MWIFASNKLLNNLIRMSFYAVAKGRTVGIFPNWNECQQQISGFSNAVFKKFKTKSEAEKFIVEKGGGIAFLKTLSDTTKIQKEPNKVEMVKRVPTTSSEEDCKEYVKDEIARLSDEDLSIFIESELKEIEGIERSELAKQGTSSGSKLSQKTLKASKKRKLLPSPTAKTSKKTAFSISYIPPKATHPKKRGQYEFQEDDQGYVHVYTDGSCINNGQNNPSAGLGVYFGEDHPLNAAEPVTGRATNNVGEIQAAILAIRLASKHGVEKLLLLTDSQFLINSICVWLPNWKRKGWKLATGEDVKNKAEFVELDSLLERIEMSVRWHYVKAHAGLHGNERADQLAKEGGEKYKFNKALK